MSLPTFPEIPVLGLTGGPGGAKSSVSRALKDRWPNDVIVVDEAATWLLNNGFPPPGELPTLEAVKPFQMAVYATVREFERRAGVLAREHGFKLIVADRGRLGGAAYFPVEHKLRHFVEMLLIDLEGDYAVYDEVVHLRSIAVNHPDLYERMNALDPTPRMEGPDQARIRDADICAVWREHPKHHIIEADPDSVQPKINAVTAIAARMAGL